MFYTNTTSRQFETFETITSFQGFNDHYDKLRKISDTFNHIMSNYPAVMEENEYMSRSPN